MKKKSGLHEPARILQVTHRKGFYVELVFRDGFTKIVNLKKYLHGPAFKQARSDPGYFRQVFIDPIGETVTWPNTEDIDADVLRYDLTPAWKERELEMKQARKQAKPKVKTQALLPKRVYLSPQQIKILSRINPSPSKAVRQLIDDYQKQRIPAQSL